MTKLNALIGANSAGKSNILKAINLVLGQSYATIKSFTLEDFYNYDINNHINIEIHFENSLNCDRQVKGFRLYNDGNTVTYVALDISGSACTYNNGTEKKVTNQMRDEVPLLYITLDRQSSQQVRPSQWTMYGKLLGHINSTISSTSNSTFVTEVDTTYRNNVFPSVQPVENLLNQYVKEQTGRDLNLNLSVIDPSMILKDLRPRIKDVNGFEVDIDKEGAGIQSAVIIAIARTFASVTGMPLILAIEEPEIFLHPQGCRHFYSILKTLSNSGVQVIYTTHRETFIDIKDYQNIKLISKDGIKTIVKSFNGSITNFDEIKAASKFDLEMNEVFFAEKVILVEGSADKIAIKYAFELMGKDIDSYNVSVVECGSISGIKPMIEILNHFDIYCLAVVDEDPGNVVTANHITDIKNVLRDPLNDIFIQSPNLEGLLSYVGKFKKETALKNIPTLLLTGIPVIYQDISTRLNL